MTEEIGAKLQAKGRREFTDDMDKSAKSIKKVGDEAQKADRKAGKLATGGLAVARRGLGGLRSAATVATAALAATTAAVAGVSVKLLSMASDANETASAFGTVFEGSGDAAAKWVKETNTQFGIATAELQEAVTMFGVFGKAAGLPIDQLGEFSTAIAQAGLDMASFYNADPSEVFLALRSGLSGESEPLRRFGIFMSDAGLSAFAASNGFKKAWKDMSDGEKVAVRQAYILANLGEAQGDLARTSDGLANKMKSIKGRLTEAGTAIGTAFLPYAEMAANELDTRLQPAITWLQDNAAPMVDRFSLKAQAAFEGVTEKVRLARQAISQGGTFGEMGAMSMSALTGMDMSFLEEPINRVADALGDVWVIFRDGLIPAFNDVTSVVPGMTSVLDILDGVLDFISDNAEALRPVFVALTAAYVAHRTAVNLVYAAEKAHAAILKVKAAGGIAAYIKGTALGTVVTKAWAGAQWLLNAAMNANPIALVVIAIVGLIAIFVIAWKHSETFRNIVTGAFDAVKGAASAVWNWVSSNWPLLLAILTGPFGLAVLAIARNWDSIKSGAAEVKDWVTEKFDQVVEFFRGMPSKISSAASGMWDGIKTAFKGAINWIIRKWNGLEFSVPEVNLGPLGSFGGQKIGVPDIPLLHQGGTTTSGGIVNMKPGEELVYLPPAATVVPLPEDFDPSGVPRLDGYGDATIILQIDGRTVAQNTLRHIREEAARK